MERIKLLALSGSLRKASYNTAALTALKKLAPSPIDITLGDISGLPLFNPDREDEAISTVAELKALLADSAGLIIASPEYAHGISGPMKNALDWMVSGVEFPYKPIMLINTSPRASHALEALREVITTMSGHIVESAYVSIPLLSSDLDSSGIVENPKFSEALVTRLNMFRAAIEVLQLNNHAN